MNNLDWNVLTRSLRNFFLSRGIPFQEVDDAVQETVCRYLIVYNTSKVEKVEGALIGVAKYILKEYFRSKNKENRLVSIDTPLEEGRLKFLAYIDSFEKEKDFNTKINLVHKAILCKNQSSRNKEIVSSFFIKDIPQKTIASKHNISTTAVEMVIYRFKNRLRNEIKRLQ